MLRRNRLALECYEKSNGICWICGLTVKMDLIMTRNFELGNNSIAASVDHFVPASKGGKRNKENIRLAHRCCNVRRGNREVDEELRGWCKQTVLRLEQEYRDAGNVIAPSRRPLGEHR